MRKYSKHCYIKGRISFTLTRGFIRNSKYVKYCYNKVHILFTPTRGYIQNSEHLKYCQKGAYIIGLVTEKANEKQSQYIPKEMCIN